MTVHQLITDGYGASSNLILEGYTSAPQVSMLHSILADMEKHSISESIWAPEVWVPGIWEHNSLLQRNLAEMEKKSIGNYCFEPGIMEPGIDNADVPLRRILFKLRR